MFGKEVSLGKGTTSLISKDLTIKGNLNCQSILEIEGKVEGDINGNVVTIRESGEVSGNIVSNVLNIKGRFNGTIKNEKVNISAKSEIKASIEYCFLCVEDGAVVEGDLKRVEKSKLEKQPINLEIKKYSESKNNTDTDLIGDKKEEHKKK